MLRICHAPLMTSPPPNRHPSILSILCAVVTLPHSTSLRLLSVPHITVTHHRSMQRCRVPARRSSLDRRSVVECRLTAPPQINAAPPGARSPLLPRSMHYHQPFRPSLPLLLRSTRCRPPMPDASSAYLLVTGELVLLQIPINPSILQSFLEVSKLICCHCYADILNAFCSLS